MQQRYYDPLIGRFYSNDPVGFTASNPMMFNRYAYANNNPYKFADPDGRNPCVVHPLAAAACVVAGAYGAYKVGEAAVDAKDKVDELGDASMDSALKAEAKYDAIAKAMSGEGTLGDVEKAMQDSTEANKRVVEAAGEAAKAASQLPGTSMSGPAPTSAADLVTSGIGEAVKAALSEEKEDMNIEKQ